MACFLSALAFAGGAEANGRFPRAQRLLEHPRDARRLVLSATYGLLVTDDRGGQWRHVCEAAYGERDLTVDALSAFTAGGVLLAGIYSGVSRSAGEPCDFERTLGRSNREAVPDFALAAASPGRVLAIVTSTADVAAPHGRLYRSDDDGLSWQPWGEALPTSLSTLLTIEVAPSNSERVYLTGLGANDEGVLLRSQDGGLSFEQLPLPTAGALEHPYIAAVDPNNADRLYVRTDAWLHDAATGTATADDALLYSEDAGSSFSELMRAPGKLFGFALSPAGSEVLVGYGDPREAGATRNVDAAVLGIYRAQSGSGSFTKLYAGSVGCLTWSERGIYVCTDENETGFSLGLSENADIDLARPTPFLPLLRLQDVAGPIACEGCTAGAVCASYWLATCQGWGRTDCEALREPSCSAAGAGNGGGAGAEGPAVAGSPAADTTVLAARGGCSWSGRAAVANGFVMTLLLLLASYCGRRWSRAA